MTSARINKLLLLFALATTPFLTAQTGLETHVIGIDIPTIPNAPFTAKDTGVWNDILPGGGTVTTKHYTVIARNSAGLVRRETRQRLPADSQVEDRLITFYFLDPVNHMRINCVVATKLCQVVDLPHPIPALKMTPRPPGPVPGGRYFTRESLGVKDFLGMPTTGFRDTFTTAPDARGNSGVLIETFEMWLSSDLGMLLYSKRSGPQFGDITLTISDLVRGEPDPALLSVPAGYKVIDARASAVAH